MQPGSFSQQVFGELIDLANHFGAQPESFLEGWGPLVDLAYQFGNHPETFLNAVKRNIDSLPREREKYQQAWREVKPLAAQKENDPISLFAARLDKITAPYGIWADWSTILRYLDNLGPAKARRGRPPSSGARKFSSREDFLARIGAAGRDLLNSGQPITQTAIGDIILPEKEADPQGRYADSSRGVRYWMKQFQLKDWTKVLKLAGLK